MRNLIPQKGKIPVKRKTKAEIQRERNQPLFVGQQLFEIDVWFDEESDTFEAKAQIWTVLKIGTKNAHLAIWNEQTTMEDPKPGKPNNRKWKDIAFIMPKFKLAIRKNAPTSMAGLYLTRQEAFQFAQSYIKKQKNKLHAIERALRENKSKFKSKPIKGKQNKAKLKLQKND